MSLSSARSRRLVIVLAAVASSIALLSYGWSLLRVRLESDQGGSLSLEDEKSSRRTITALGKVEPAGGILKLAGPSFEAGPSIVASLLVREGDAVEEGQIIAALKSLEQYEADVAALEKTVSVAETRFGQAKKRIGGGDVEAASARVRASAAEERRAQSDYRRFRALYETAAISEQDELRQKTLAEERTEARREAEETLRKLKSDRAMEVELAEAELAEAHARLERARTRVHLGRIIAPCAGRILKVIARDGEIVTERGVVEMGRTDEYVVIAEVYESDVGRLKVGQRARVSSAAWTSEISGVVETIGSKVNRNEVMGPDPVTDADARVVRVRILLQNPGPAAALVNLQATVTIEL